MENNTENIRLNENQMQELLPDFVFGRLNDSDKMKFENNLQFYPEIQQEIKDVQSVFGKLQSMDIEKPIRDRSRNLSVKVNDKLNKRKSSIYGGFLNPKLAMPIIAILIGGLMIVYYGNQKKSQEHLIADLQILTEQDIETINNPDDEFSLIEESINIQHSENSVDYSDITQFEDEINQITESEIKNMALKNPKELSVYLSNFNQFDPTFLDELNILNEEEFQKLYEELKNEDINS